MNVVKLIFVLSMVFAFGVYKFLLQPFLLGSFRSATNFPAASLLVPKVEITSIQNKVEKIVDTKALMNKQGKMSYLLAQTITHLRRMPTYAANLKGPIAWQLTQMPTGNAPVCFRHFFMTPDNQGGVYVVGEWRDNILSSPGGRMSYSLIHYKANGTSDNILDLKDSPGFPEDVLYGIGLSSNSNLYMGRRTWSKDEGVDEIQMVVARIVDFPNSKKLEPYVGLNSDFQINLLDFCSEIPELCNSGKLSYSDLAHLSMDAKDNLYLAFQWPKPTILVDGYAQVTLLKITPSEKVVRVGSFPIFSIDPQTNRFIALHSLRYGSLDTVTVHVEFSLAVDQSDNIFIHHENVLFQFESTPQGYGPVKVVTMLDKAYSQRSIAFHPEGGIVALKNQEYSIWQMLPGFAWKLFLGLPHESVLQLGTAQQTRFQSPWEIVCDRAGRLFVFDNGSDAIVVYK
jgi:hypothetical protein